MEPGAPGGAAPSSDAGTAGRTPQDPSDPSPPTKSTPMAEPWRVPGVGNRLHQLIPETSRQVLAVYGDGEDSPDSTIVLYEKDEDDAWKKAGRWRGHNGREGWTVDHHEGDLRTPVGVFTLSDAGGVLDDPGTLLPYDQGKSYEVPKAWGEAHRHDFDYVIAVDYNRVRGTPPNDPTRPNGDEKGGGIWLHLDHGDGTSACVTLPEAGMEYLLRTLDPDQYPVVVMGNREVLKA
ncbi:L,D-transpeptidase family protein [Streptomyces sp. NPDC047079]|uniref:L,D-transpeptidase family protein n=1 Tax=Streptomyces sp. NPDC047079 TaxID=3154607 RepID=UPI0033D7A776